MLHPSTWPQWKKDFLVAFSSQLSNREVAKILGGTASAIANQIATLGIPNKTREQAKLTQARGLMGSKRGAQNRNDPNEHFDGLAGSTEEATEQALIIIASYQPTIRKSKVGNGNVTGFAPGTKSGRSRFDIEDETKYRKIKVRDFSACREVRIDHKTVILVEPHKTDEEAIANYNRNLERTNQAFAKMA